VLTREEIVATKRNQERHDNNKISICCNAVWTRNRSASPFSWRLAQRLIFELLIVTVKESFKNLSAELLKCWLANLVATYPNRVACGHRVFYLVILEHFNWSKVHLLADS
jgi:hypothetical protein